jgi:hypothetical protein
MAGFAAGLSPEFVAASFGADAPEADRSEPDAPLHLPKSPAAAIRLTHNTDKPIGEKRISDLEGWVAGSVEEFMDGG